MADTRVVAGELGDKVAYRQTTEARMVSATYAGVDTDYRVTELNMFTDGGLTYGVTNETNKTVTVTLYGAFESGVDPGDEAAFPIDSTGFTVLTASSDYTTTTDKFPYYLVRCKFAAVPDGENVTVKACGWQAAS